MNRTTQEEVVASRADCNHEKSTAAHLSRAQVGYGPVHIEPPWRSAKNVTLEANAHKNRNRLAVRRVYWREQGRNDLTFQQAGFERTAQ